MQFEWVDAVNLGFLVLLEGLLSLDNALVLALMTRHLPPKLQTKALTYGLVGAVVFRTISVFAATKLMGLWWAKIVGGGYLVFLALKHAWQNRPGHSDKDEVQPETEAAESIGESASKWEFWKTVALVELMDIAFAIDSILAAVALTPKIPLIILGGMIGVVLIRFAAKGFSALLYKFPRLEHSSYMLVFLVGAKLIIEAGHFPGVNFHSPQSPEFWIFWCLMLASLLVGVIKKEN